MSNLITNRYTVFNGNILSTRGHLIPFAAKQLMYEESIPTVGARVTNPRIVTKRRIPVAVLAHPTGSGSVMEPQNHANDGNCGA